MKIILTVFLVFLLTSPLLAGYDAYKDSFEIKIAHEQKITDAIEKGDSYKISRYINSGLDVNKRILGGTTLLFEAIKDKQLAIVNLFSSQGLTRTSGQLNLKM